MPTLPERPGRMEPRPKRHKIDVACDTCRARKVKCDGTRPACSNCLKRLDAKDNCRYSAGIPERPSTTSIRLPSQAQYRPSAAGGNAAPRTPRSLGTSTSNAIAARNTPRPSAVDAMSNVARPQPSALPGQSPGSASVRSNPDATSRHGWLSGDPSPSYIDSMTAVVEDGVSSNQYFGSSSAGSFTKHIKAAIDARLGQTATRTQDGVAAPGMGSNSGPGMRGIEDDPDYVLPRRKQADHLMGVYWFWVHPLYPFLDKERWERSYEALFAGTPLHTDERVFVTTLNVIFALSTQMLEALLAEHRDDSSNIYFHRAQNLLHLNLWEPGSFELVQCLLLMSQYLQSTNNPHQTWMVVGSAIRIAQSLGLHLPETTANLTDGRQRELLRTVWHGCVLMDRMVSVTHGRPAMISRHVASAAPLPLSSSVDSVAQLSDSLIRSSFFVKSVELYEIINLIILAFYSEHGQAGDNTHGSSCPVPPGEDVGMVMKLDESLSEWKHGVPNHLRLDLLDEISNEICRRQAVILHLRFLQARILLLRPTMAQFCLGTPQDNQFSTRLADTLKFRVIQQCASLCVATAQRVTSLIAHYLPQDGTVGLLPAWWYRVYYIYSAATILIVAKLRPDVFPLADIKRSWDEAISILRAHESFGQQSARRCLAALEILSSKIVHGSPPSQGPQVSDDARPTTDNHSQEEPQTGIMSFMDFPDLPPLDLSTLPGDTNFMSWLNVSAWDLLNES